MAARMIRDVKDNDEANGCAARQEAFERVQHVQGGQAVAKQGQHNSDSRDQDKSRGHNNPKKSTPITTGTPKKRATYRKQAREHQDTAKQAQDAKNEWHNYADPAMKNLSKRDRVGRSERSGSDSNADTGTRGS